MTKCTSPVKNIGKKVTWKLTGKTGSDSTAEKA